MEERTGCFAWFVFLVSHNLVRELAILLIKWLRDLRIFFAPIKNCHGDAR